MWIFYYGFWDYLSLLLDDKYFNKNDKFLAYGIMNKSGQKTTLKTLLEVDNLTKDKVLQYFEICKKCQIKLPKETFDKAIKMCKTKDKLKKNPNIVTWITTPKLIPITTLSSLCQMNLVPMHF